MKSAENTDHTEFGAKNCQRTFVNNTHADERHNGMTLHLITITW